MKRELIRYTAEQKLAIVARMMTPQNEAIAIIHEEAGVTEATLYKWRKEARTADSITPRNGQTSDKWSNQDNLLVVMETFPMNEKELADYCHRKDLYREQIEVWKDVFLQANGQHSIRRNN